MHSTALKSPLDIWNQPGRAFDLRTFRTVTLRVFDEVRVPERQAEIRETIHRLLPPDHAIGRVFQDQHHEIQLKANRGFHFLRIHHETAVAADGEHLRSGYSIAAIIADG